MKTFASRIFLVLAALTLLDQRSDTAAESPDIACPFPAGLLASQRFHVTVNGLPVFTHAAEVADFAMFAIRGPVQVTVVCEQPVTSATIRPRTRKIVPQWEAKTVRFTVDGPGPLSDDRAVELPRRPADERQDIQLARQRRRLGYLQ